MSRLAETKVIQMFMAATLLVGLMFVRPAGAISEMSSVVQLPGAAKAVTQDGNGNLLLAVASGGLGRITEHGFELIVAGDVGGVAAALDGALYYTLGTSILRLGDEGEATDVTDQFGGQARGARRVSRSADGSIWVEGCPLRRQVDGSFAAVPTHREAGWSVVPTARDIHGNTWGLVTTANGRTGVALLAAGMAGAWSDQSPPGGPWSSLTTDAVGFVWVGGPDGLRRLAPHKEDESWIELPAALSLPTAAVTALARSPDGRALVCYATGEVLEIDYNSSTDTAEVRHLSEEPLPAPPQIALTDSRGNVWLGIGDALHRIDATRKSWQRHWQVLSPLPGGNHDIFAVELDGRLYTAGGATGGLGLSSDQPLVRRAVGIQFSDGSVGRSGATPG